MKTLVESFLAGGWRDFLASLGLAVGVAAFCHAQIAEARFIPSGSMAPTLAIGDRVLIEKLSYHLGRPRRGDIVVFHPPAAVAAYGFDGQVPWIKRVVGLPGERVAVHAGRVWIDDRAVAEGYLDEPPAYEMPARRVAAGQLFVLGDNRNHSIDSHVWGDLPLTNVIGHAAYRLWPPAHFGDLALGPAARLTAVRTTEGLARR